MSELKKKQFYYFQAQTRGFENWNNAFGNSQLKKIYNGFSHWQAVATTWDGVPGHWLSSFYFLEVPSYPTIVKQDAFYFIYILQRKFFIVLKRQLL